MACCSLHFNRDLTELPPYNIHFEGRSINSFSGFRLDVPSQLEGKGAIGAVKGCSAEFALGVLALVELVFASEGSLRKRYCAIIPTATLRFLWSPHEAKNKRHLA